MIVGLVFSIEDCNTEYKIFVTLFEKREDKQINMIKFRFKIQLYIILNRIL